MSTIRSFFSRCPLLFLMLFLFELIRSEPESSATSVVLIVIYGAALLYSTSQFIPRHMKRRLARLELRDLRVELRRLDKEVGGSGDSGSHRHQEDVLIRVVHEIHNLEDYILTI